jgi:hypothetical protein
MKALKEKAPQVNKKYSWKPFQQTGTSGRQNCMTWGQLYIIETNRWTHREKWDNMIGICKNSATPLRAQTYESWVLKKEKRCKPKV